MTTVKIRCMSAPTVGDRYRLLDGLLMTDMMGFPVPACDDDDAELCRISTVAAVAKIGAHWSNQPEGLSGYYVALIAV